MRKRMRAKPATLPTTLPTIVGVGATPPPPEPAAAVDVDAGCPPAVPVGPSVPPGMPVSDALAEDKVGEVLVVDERAGVVDDERVFRVEVELEDVVLVIRNPDVGKEPKDDDDIVAEFEFGVTMTGNVAVPELVREGLTKRKISSFAQASCIGNVPDVVEFPRGGPKPPFVICGD